MQTLSQPQTNTFVSEQGLNVVYKHWKVADTPKATVVFAHGFNSHSGYFQWPAEQLTAQNYEVYAIDFPGRGNQTANGTI
ncbi:hypothetical protein GCM10028808_09150 [Spirosoma migulaei]